MQSLFMYAMAVLFLTQCMYKADKWVPLFSSAKKNFGEKMKLCVGESWEKVDNMQID